MKNISEQVWRKGVSLLLVLCMICTLFGQYLPCIVAKAANTTTYTVELNGTSDMLLSNATASNGPVTLTYTVESLTTTTGNNGVVATPSPLGAYPYSSGKLNYHNTKNRMLEVGKTYTLELSVDANGAVAKTCSWTNESAGTSGTSIDLPHNTGDGSTESQYFGIYVGGSTTAKLTNVTCVDSEGNNLGLQVNTKNSDKCTITADSQGGNTPGGDGTEDHEPIELVPADDGNAEKHTLNIDAESNFFFGNKEAASGIVTLRYTVESSITGNTNNGVVATTNPTGEFPYTSGDMYYHNTANRMMVEGRTYTIVLGVDESGYVVYEGSWTNEAENTSGSLSLPTHTSGNATDAQYYGIYVSSSTTATLTNVTCVDTEGNDLGIGTNQKETLPVPDDSNAVKYTVKTGKVSSLFIGNKLASEKAVTLRYTVESAVADTVNNNGVVATTKPNSTYPYTSGSMKFYHLENVVMAEGRTYTFTMTLDNNGKVNYEGYYTDAENTSPVLLEGKLPTPAGDGATDSQYYGIYVAPATEVKLINVTCVDADGNDLGIQTNAVNCLITAGDDEEQGAEEILTSDYAAITLGNFGIKDGTYTKAMKKGSYALSMHKKVFSVDIEFSKDVGEDFRYGGKADGWHGLRFWSDKTCIYMEDVDGRSEQYTFIPLIAGTTLVGEEFNLKISTEYVDCDADGEKDDVKLGVWFNNKLYDNEYIYLKDYKKMLGKNIGVYSSNEIAYITVKSVAGIETGIDYTIFGFTRNWMQELGIK